MSGILTGVRITVVHGNSFVSSHAYTSRSDIWGLDHQMTAVGQNCDDNGPFLSSQPID